MIARLVLTDVRSHAALTLTPGPGFVIITGPNGVGKTNVLEAVSLLAPGRGLRRVPLSQVQREQGPGGFGIAATLEDGSAIATGTLAGTPERRVVRINGSAAPASALAERLTILWLTPAMDRLFVEPKSERRAFLDRLTLALSPGHAIEVTRYEAAMRARNKLLAKGSADREWLSALERQMAQHGAALHAARCETVALLDARPSAGAGDFPSATLSLDGWDGGDLSAALREGRARDAVAGRTLTGPHRSDLIVTHRDKAAPAARASTGEQKALLLGIVLAHADLVTERRGMAPVLLLDEVAAHLDPDRRAALFDRLSGRGQVWMTGTEAGLFDRADGTRITLP